MAEPNTVVVDQKPKEQLPVDPDVKIPDSVKRRSEAVDAYFAQQKPSDPAASSQAADATSTPPVAHQPPPVASPPSPAADLDPNWRPEGPIENASVEQRYVSMQGRYQEQLRQNKELQEQMAQMGDELMRTHDLVRKQNGRQQPQPPRPWLTDQDVKEYGSDVLDLAQRAAMHAVSPELTRIEQENARLRQQMADDRKRALYQTLDQAVPNWRQIDELPRWRQWLLLPEVYSGSIRQQLLNGAISAADAPRVISFFRGFLQEEAATGHAEPNPQPPPTPQVPPREPAIPLASLAAPGRPRPAGGGDSPPLPGDKPIYSRTDIARQYKLHNSGKWPGTEADWKRWENDLFLAQHEGRIRN